jgi:hypothetical protein
VANLEELCDPQVLEFVIVRPEIFEHLQHEVRRTLVARRV